MIEYNKSAESFEITKKRHALHKKQFYNDWQVGENVRDESNEEFRFTAVASGQWEGWLEESYEDRAKMEFNHTGAFLRRNYTQYTQARPQVNFAPSDNATSPEDAEFLDGMYRRDVNANGGQDSLDTAARGGLSCGMGAVLLSTQYEDEGDPENDNQNIVFTELPNAYSTVVFDSTAKRADKSDAGYVTIIMQHSYDAFEEMYPNHEPSSMRVEDRSWFNWSDVHQKSVYIATRYEIEEKKIVIHTYSNPANQEIVKINEDDLEDHIDDFKLYGYGFLRKRTVTRKCVYKTVFSGAEELEAPRKIVGKELPVVPCYGYREWVDGVEYFRGIVREHMDAQRLLNMGTSLVAETAAHSTSSIPIFAPEQMENQAVRQGWAENVHQKSYQLAGMITDAAGNKQVVPPTILQGTSVSPALASLLQITNESMQAGLGGAPQDIVDVNSSGKALNAMFKRADMNTAPAFDNIDRFTKRVGVVYQSMASEVYGSSVNKGRVVRTINDKGEGKSVTLLERTGADGSLKQTFDLSTAKFEVVVGIGKSYQTEREEEFDKIKDVITIIDPQDPMRGELAKTLLLLMDSRGLKDIQKVIRRNQVLSGFVEPTTDEEIAMIEEQQAQPEQPDPNAAYLQAAALEKESQADLNEASIADKMGSAAKKAAETKKIVVDTQIITREAQIAAQQQ